MIALTDDKYFYERYADVGNLRNIRVDSLSEPLKAIAAKLSDGKSNLFKADNLFRNSKLNDYWNAAVLINIAKLSQYDSLIELSREISVPDKLLCLAGAGEKFHGQRNRAWQSAQGNIHLAVHFKPEKKIEGFGAGLLTLAALSVAETINGLPNINKKARIKWVNDIVIDGAKVGGVLSYSQAQGEKTTDAIIGVGLNVETKPKFELTKFVPRIAKLTDFSDERDYPKEKAIFAKLAERLAVNYEILLSNNCDLLIEKYRDLSAVIGKKVEIWSDERSGASQKITEGEVESIGENLELYLKKQKEPIRQGRLALAERK